MYNSKDTMMYSVDGFKIIIKGKGSHGAYPHVGVDPINIGVHVHLALQELIARESDPSKACVLTIGQFKAGTAANIIPEEAILQMNLLGHSFFVFRNTDFGDAICVVYRRNNGGYGIIETEDDEE